MSNETNKENLFIIRNKFLCCVPVIEIDLKEFLLAISWSEQETLINHTINNELLKKYPIKFSYQKAFLKSIITILENNCIEVHDSLYDAYCFFLNREDTEKYFFKHYIVDDKIITLKENKNFISDGTTGLCIWQASLALSQWCFNNKNKLQNQTILELGSGVGLVGLTSIIHCQPKVFYLSDCHPKVLQILSENIEINIPRESHKKNGDNKLCVSQTNVDVSCGSQTNVDVTVKNSDLSCGLPTTKDFQRLNRGCDNCDELIFGSKTIAGAAKTGNSNIFVLNLPWETVEENKDFLKIRPDIIFAADVVYDNTVFKPLCGALKFFLNLNKNCEVIFVCTERNSDTLAEFLQLLESSRFTVTNFEAPDQKDFFWSDSTPIRFFRITKA